MILDSSGKMLALNRISRNSDPFLSEIYILIHSEIFYFVKWVSSESRVKYTLNGIEGYLRPKCLLRAIRALF